MEIPYTVSTRPDTGLWNAKVGIWLFLASEVMLFGGLFSAYIFLRLDAPPGMWPHGLLNVPVGTMNTAILIMSSVTVVLAWAALKMRRYRAYWWYMRSEEHTSELQSRLHLVCRLLLEKKKTNRISGRPLHCRGVSLI